MYRLPIKFNFSFIFDFCPKYLFSYAYINYEKGGFPFKSRDIVEACITFKSIVDSSILEVEDTDAARGDATVTLIFLLVLLHLLIFI